MAPAEVGGGKQQERVKFFRRRRLRIAPGALRPRNDRLQKMRWRRGTWTPPYKVILYMRDGRGRTPPLRICGDVLRSWGGRTEASAPTGALLAVQWVVDVKKLGGFLVNFNHLKILLLFCNFCVAFLIDLCYTKLR